ncbi:ATP synthase subunit b [Halolactibacillus alkaliphilus]|uniref:ATP synthase subunit b n=1 Tax=Halolactibacillus alkaliphilus TaxID=442899 RepID=A0A511X451_9BACI|nr:F0F1 ATP synthase subunit B [Halolactibacillus alkaliphilus]GEN57728.1 ATP synthase subunit b [Halolactibacillus alkaliphilus]GGN73885.1 ATP synthase subunit b [Halolactibacillus alkaliphilus]SFO99181.1 ATP synthase F0 subcomplex B subunit [Halolactibacillus alkaliphilus]
MLTTNIFTLGATVGGFQPLDTIVVLVSFSILMVLLKKFAWGPLIKVMEERENFVATEIETAQEKNRQAQMAVKEADEKLAEARQEAKRLVVEAKQTATKLEDSIIQEAKDRARQMRMDAEDEIEQEKRESFQEMQETVAEIAFQIAMDIIQKEMSQEDQKRLIKERLDTLGDDLL